jgi:hypothetical protein
MITHSVFLTILPNRLYPFKATPGSRTHEQKLATEYLCLLEVWNGCISSVPITKRVSSVLGEWGYLKEREEMVKLVVVKKSVMLAYLASKQAVRR